MDSAYRVLARKYRPTTFEDVVGQLSLVNTLTKAIEENRVPQAFLLHGIRGTGKTTTARLIARALNCIGADGQGKMTATPCGVCTSCVGIAGDRHLDVLEMDAASRTGVDDIREITESARYKAVQGRFKIFIIDEVHMLSKSAFNALLKTLEEPPPHVKFIFATTEIRKIPDTIRSRCMRFDLKRIEISDLAAQFDKISKIEGFELDTEAANMLARASDGSMRDGLSMLDQAMALCLMSQGKHITSPLVQGMLGLSDEGFVFDILDAIFEGRSADVLAKTREAYTLGADPVLFLQDILDVVYFMITVKSASAVGADVSYTPAKRAWTTARCEKLSMPVLMRCWQALLSGYDDLQKSPLLTQTLEVVLLRLCFMVDLPTLDQLAKPQNIMASQSVTSMTTASQTTPVVRSFDEMVSLLTQAKEPILASHLVHDVRLVSFEPGAFSCALTDKAPKTFPSDLKTILKRLTQQDWRIEIVNTATSQTAAEKANEIKENQAQKALQQPHVQALKSAFGDVSITVLSGEAHAV